MLEWIRPSFLCLALVCSGLGAGTAYTTYFWFKPGKEGVAAWFAELQYAVPRIGVPLFVLQPLAFLGTVVSTILAWNDRPSSWFLAVATLCLLVTALVTRVGHIPINQRVQTWKPSELPPDAAAVRQRWWRLHVARTVLLLIGVTSIVLGAMTGQR
jgi:uncharacterized membrane protein